MLPDFPSLKIERMQFLQQVAYTRSISKHPILPELRASKQHEGSGIRLLDVEGNLAMSEYRHFQSRIEVSTRELPTLDDAAWLVKLETMTDELASDKFRNMIECVEEAAASCGNSVSADGKPVTADMILDLFEKVEIDFEDNRISSGFKLVAAPNMLEKISELEKTEEFQHRYARIIEEKRIAFRLRQADRKLVD